MGAEAAITTVVKLLGDVLTQEVIFLRSVKDQVQSLKDELTMMQSFLKDANKKQVKDERVRTWIEDIRDVALDTEDTIEMFTLNIEIARGGLQCCTCFPSHLCHLHKIGNEIQSIHDRLAKIRESRETFGISNLGDPSESSEVDARRLLDTSHKDEHLVGMEDDLEKLVGQITDEEKKGLSVAAIVGMGGIGKSTLAREIYHHPNIVCGRFDCRAWVVVSSDFTPQETIKQLILETTTSELQEQKLLDKIKRLEESMRDKLYLQSKLAQMLHRELKRKTYFIVLDDVWKKEDLDRLKTIFPDEQDETSRLLVTSRDRNIAIQCQIFHEMELLDTEKSWELFLKKGLTGNNCHGGFPKELEQIGRQIVEKCKGLPLAITVMGGLLAEKLFDREWKEALKEFKSIRSVENIVSLILELSYNNLSPELKCCFLCLAFFIEDATIPVKRLVNIMVGQGFIQQTSRTAEEDIARRYLGELINRNLVQVKDLTLDSRAKSCHLHDSLRELCLSKSKKEIGFENLIGDRKFLLKKPRHQVVYSDDLGKGQRNRNKHIRSIFMLNVNVGGFRAIKSSYWKSFKHLKTLDLEVNYPMSRLPSSMRFLLGLKQLRIHTINLEQSLELPIWLNKFKKLELLDIVSARAVFPKVALEMDSLRHINASYIDRVKIGESCKNLESLKYIMQSDWINCSLRQRDDCHVQKLGIVMDDPSTMRALLDKLENLVKLVLWFSGPPIYLECIPLLENLTKLKLVGKMKKCPSVSMFPPNLSHLTLEKSELGKDSMQELGKLPKLLYLKLNCDSYSGKRIKVIDGGFPTLRGLRLRELSELRSVDIKGGMPQLKLLQVYGCPDLYPNNLSNKSYHLQIQTLKSKSVDMAAEEAISSVVKLLGDVNFHRGVQDQMVLLKDKLIRMQSFLKDAIKMQAQDERVRNWMWEIREVALDAEDAIDNIENASMMGHPSCGCFPIHARHFDRKNDDIELILARLVEIDKSRESYGIKNLGELGEQLGGSEVEEAPVDSVGEGRTIDGLGG